MLELSNDPAKVFQHDFSPAKGNALQACVASLFHQELSQVPNFITLECGYEQGIQDYLKRNSVYTAIKNKLPAIPAGDEGNLCILRGKSPRGDFAHVVVAKIVNGKFSMVFDPHPDGLYLDTSEEFGWYMVFKKDD